MTLNCKTGDLAIVIRSLNGNEGMIVQCLQFVGMVTWVAPGRENMTLPSWRVDREIPGCFGHSVNLAPDSSLRPLRNDKGSDETLSWCDVPEGVAA